MSDLAGEMMAKIDAGLRLESAREMTAEYRESLVHLMTMQADSELAGGYGYVPWIAKAPSGSSGGMPGTGISTWASCSARATQRRSTR